MKKTYLSSNDIVCPICGARFKKERLHTGRGRLHVENLTVELRYLYKLADDNSVVSPLVYAITVCPQCQYAALDGDFTKIAKTDAVKMIERKQNKRIESLAAVFPKYNFNEERTIYEGIVSYYLAMQCYEVMPEKYYPTFKQGQCALRAAWLLTDLDKIEPNNNWGMLAKGFYRKARFCYKLVVENEENQVKALPDDVNYGPDVDKNFGFDGVLYIASILELNWGSRQSSDLRTENLRKAGQRLSRIFGMGKISKIKPVAILENAQWVFNLINKEIRTLKR